MGDVPILDEEVPISVDSLIELRTVFANVGIGMLKMLQAAEQDVDATVFKICLSHGVLPHEFGGIDIEKGVIRKKHASVNVEADKSLN